MRKVVLGMSGGVDSSVTAYLLKEQGYQVEGISFILWESRGRTDLSGCCSLSSTQSAARTAGRLGILHESVDVRDEFIEKVIEPFAEAYAQGMTPNPCILCNQHIKFPFLLREAEKRGAAYIATGHYARTCRDAAADGRVLLKKGIDEKKDQSYVLYVLSGSELKSLILPLGEYRKPAVREIARGLGLEAADRPESQEICFIEDNDYAGFLEKLSPELTVPGPIADTTGRQIGQHQGIHRYTIGQRKGLGVPSLVPQYVTRVDAAANTVYIGSRDEAFSRELSVRQLSWLVPSRSGSFRAEVKVRSTMQAVPARIEIAGDTGKVIFDEPQWAPAPGQSAVFYEAETVLGGGIIQPQ
ncbi:MAG: tRNA 2-thiouridine(34) synthase MnmA [Nitrospirae bacterium]|nr:MAG: tRNA 2-thiouridine(34) synthase MnmA [Nitrospirota bacterium]